MEKIFLQLTPFNKKLFEFLKFLNRVNFSNKIFVYYPERFKTYKYRIKRGNNSLVIRNAIKTRWWWSKADKAQKKDFSVLNFNWEAGRNNPWLKTLPLCEDYTIGDGKEKNSDSSTRDMLSEDS